MGQILFVVWRESVEAMLVVGILYTWLRHNPSGRAGLPWLWGGVAAGLGVAGLLGAAMLGFSDLLTDQGQELFTVAMMLAASGLIVHMVLWMRRNGRTLKRNMESVLADSSARASWWSVFTLTALAVAREGSETVVFLFGLGAGVEGIAFAQFALAAGAGLALAGFTFWLLQLGGKVISWRLFFRVTEILLLLLAAALLIGGVERLISLDILPGLIDPLWDSSALLDDGSPVGGLIATFTGYRAHPALTMLLAYVGYWAMVGLLMRTPRPKQPAAA